MPGVPQDVSLEIAQWARLFDAMRGLTLSGIDLQSVPQCGASLFPPFVLLGRAPTTDEACPMSRSAHAPLHVRHPST